MVETLNESVGEYRTMLALRGIECTSIIDIKFSEMVTIRFPITPALMEFDEIGIVVDEKELRIVYKSDAMHVFTNDILFIDKDDYVMLSNIHSSDMQRVIDFMKDFIKETSYHI